MIFCVADSTHRAINGIALLTDTGIGNQERWLRRFQIQVSVTGVAPGDFRTVLDTVKATGAMEVFPIDPVPARFVKLIALTPNNGAVQLGELEVYLGEESTTSVTDQTFRMPEQFRLAQNYPNPFNPTTMIRFEIPRAAHLKLVIYNLLGEEIRTLFDGEKPAGCYDIEWDGKNSQGVTMPTGNYLYVLSTNDYRDVKKMILAK